MIERHSTWGEVEKGDYIKDKNGTTWRVVSQTTLGMTYLANRAMAQTSIPTPDPARPVIKMTPTQDEAIAVVQKVLGGTVLHDTH